MLPILRTPTAAEVKTDVAPVREQDPLTRPIESLQQNGVAVLVNALEQPSGILTECDLDSIKQRLDKAEKSATAKELFESRPVYTVRDDASLEDVAKELAKRRLTTGITVVAGTGRYVGYAFNRDVRAKLNEFVEQSEREIRSKREELSTEYPELRKRWS
jgi:CBS domain-containing protein